MFKKSNKTSKRISTICISLALLTLALPINPAGAAGTNAEISAIEKQISDLEAQKKEYQKTLNGLNASSANALSVKNSYEEQIKVIEQKIKATDNLISEYDSLIAETESGIDSKEEEIDARFEEFLERMSVNYEDGYVNYLALLLESGSLSEMLSNTERTADVLEYDRNLMDTLEREKESLGDRKSELENARKAQEKAKTELAEDKKEAQSKTSDMQAYIDKLANDTAKTEQMLADAQKLDDELNARLEQALKALAEKEVPQYTVDKNSMMWPVSVNYNTISSPYGMRYIFGSNYMHYGIDIPAPAGSNVYACQSGVVEIATSHSSYGNYIVINHGGGYATLYAHNYQLLVSAGTQVSKGDVIALVGRTGSATGNHCHLEVRYNGAHQNPLNFLTQP